MERGGTESGTIAKGCRLMPRQQRPDPSDSVANTRGAAARRAAARECGGISLQPVAVVESEESPNDLCARAE